VDAPAALFPQIATFAMTLAFGWCYAAASIKRLHDRNKSGCWIVPYIVAPGLYGHFGECGGSWPAVFMSYAMYIALLRGLNRDVLPAGNARAEPVRARSAGAG